MALLFVILDVELKISWILPTNCLSFLIFSPLSDLIINLSSCVQCLFTSSRSPYSRVGSVMYSWITIYKTLKWSSHISKCVKNLRRLSFYIKRLVVPSWTNRCLLVWLPVFFPLFFIFCLSFFWFTKERLQNPFSIISIVFYLPLKENVQQTVMRIYSRVKNFHRILSDPSHRQHHDLSKFHSPTRTCSAFRFISCRININGKTIVPHLARIPTNRDGVLIDFLCNLSRL